MDSYQPYPIRRDAVLCSLAELPDGGSALSSTQRRFRSSQVVMREALSPR